MTAEVIRSESPITTESSRSSLSLFSTDHLEQESALSAISDEDTVKPEAAHEAEHEAEQVGDAQPA